MNFVFPSVKPTVRNTVSVGGTEASYTIQSLAAGVPADPMTPTLNVAADDAVLQTLIVDTTAVSDALVLSSVE
jgi:hypothetical protein